MGHTHEDIDARFGTLSQHIREMNIYTPQALLSAIEDAFIGDCKVTFVGAIYNYFDYYDAFVDHTLMIKKEEYTVLGWRYQTLTEEEKLANPALLDVAVGTPKPHALKPWAAKYRAFMRGMRAKFPRESEKYIHAAYETFLLDEMPLMPGTSPPQPSDDIFDFVVARGSDFQPPLGKYLYGARPMGFEHLREGKKLTITPCEPSTLDTAFTGTFAGKEVSVSFATPISFLTPPSHLFLIALTLQTWIDAHVKCIVTHELQTIPHRGLPRPYLQFEHGFPEMLQGVIVETKKHNKVTRKYDDVLVAGRIVARVPDTIDRPAQYRVRVVCTYLIVLSAFILIHFNSRLFLILHLTPPPRRCPSSTKTTRSPTRYLSTFLSHWSIPTHVCASVKSIATRRPGLTTSTTPRVRIWRRGDSWRRRRRPRSRRGKTQSSRRRLIAPPQLQSANANGCPNKVGRKRGARGGAGSGAWGRGRGRGHGPRRPGSRCGPSTAPTRASTCASCSIAGAGRRA